jgi:hypothetical protein
MTVVPIEQCRGCICIRCLHRAQRQDCRIEIKRQHGEPHQVSGKSGEKDRGRRREARPVFELAALVLEPVIARRAGMKIDLLAGWAQIAGPLHADYTRPEKIIWPRQRGDDDPYEPGVLVVACDGARAVLFQHELSQVLERLNIFFGFDAVARIKIVQKPVVQVAARRRHGLPPIDAASASRIEAIVQGVDDEKLRKSLAELGRGVIGRARRS